MMPRIFDREPERDAAYRNRAITISHTPEQQDTRRESVRTTQTSGRLLSLLPRPVQSPQPTRAATASTTDISPQVLPGTPTPSQDFDELGNMVQHPAWNALRRITVPSAPNGAEITIYQSLMSLARIAQADMHARAAETWRDLEVLEYRREIAYLGLESSWNRLERIHEISQSLALHQTNLAPVRTDTVERMIEPMRDLFSESAVREVSTSLLSESASQRLVASQPFQCPVCFEAVSNPVIFMPCGHTLCRACFEGMERVARRSMRALSCHMCRQRLELYTLWEHVRAELEDGMKSETTKDKGDGERGGDCVVVAKGCQDIIRRVRGWSAQVYGWFGS